MNNVLKTFLFVAGSMVGTSCSNQYMGYQASHSGRIEQARAQQRDESRVMTQTSARSEKQQDKIDAAAQSEIIQCPQTKKKTSKPVQHQKGWQMGPFAH